MAPRQIFFILIVTFISLIAMDKPLSSKNITIELKSYDNQIVNISLNVALQSPTLADILKNFQEGHTRSIPFTTIDGETLVTVVKILTAFYKHQDLKGKALLDAVEKDVPIYDSNALLLLRAFDFLDFMPGVRLVARYVTINSTTTQSPRSFTDNIKQILYGKPLLDYVSNLRRTNQLSANTIREIGRMYYLLLNKDVKEHDIARNFKKLSGFQDDEITFSLRDYLNYLPHIIKKRHTPTTLNLDNLPLHDLDGIDDISGIQLIEELEISNTKITTLPNFSLIGFNSLTRLIITDGKLKTLPESCLHGLNRLEVCAISFQPFTEVPAALFQGLVNLRILQLFFNQLTELPAMLFKGLHNLENLSLGVNKLTFLSQTLFKDLAKLEELSLPSNQLIELPPLIFAPLTNVRTINLGANPLRRLDPQLFAGLTHLHKIVIYDNKLSPENIRELKKAFPQVKIKTQSW